MRRSPLLRFPDLKLLDKLRVLALVRNEACGDILVRLARGGIEAEFAGLPEQTQRLARVKFTLAGTGPRGRKAKRKPAGGQS